MSIKQMHYSFKQKLNKIDSNQNINFRIPEIDNILREAELMYIQQRVQKSNFDLKGTFELTNKITDDLRSIIKTIDIDVLTNEGNKYIVNLPDDYLYYLKSEVNATKASNSNILKGLYTHSTEELNNFNTSSFEWSEVNVKILNNRLEIYSDNTFVINKVYLTYIKKPITCHNAEDFSGSVNVLGSDIKTYYSTYNRIPKNLILDINLLDNDTNYPIKGYKSLTGELRFGYVDSELPYHTLDQIVDLAVINTIGNIETDVNLQNNKIKTTI